MLQKAEVQHDSRCPQAWKYPLKIAWMLKFVPVWVEVPETLLSSVSVQAPFPNSGFVNGFGSGGHYKSGTGALNLTRPFNRSR